MSAVAEGLKSCHSGAHITYQVINNRHYCLLPMRDNSVLFDGEVQHNEMIRMKRSIQYITDTSTATGIRYYNM